MKRLLCIVGGMNAGGAETFLMKLYRKIDKNQFQMDFAVATADKCYYDDEILSMGGRIYKISPKSSGVVRNFNSIKKLVKREKYSYVLRTSQHSLSALELFAARIGGAKTTIFRSSNSNTTTGAGKDLLLHRICRFMPLWNADIKLAPSTEAAEFMFGKNCIKKGRAILLHNAIDLSLFHYDIAAGIRIRNELNIPAETTIIGHVGRFNQQKNHAFLLDVFKAYSCKNGNSVLLLVGKGELEPAIKEKASELGILDRIIFTGVRSDVPALLSAMDVFVFPSLYEGMPNTVIEAQATGLPCLIADTITREADITGLVHYLSLDSADAWASYIANLPQETRTTPIQKFKENCYDIESVTEQFVKLVFEK